MSLTNYILFLFFLVSNAIFSQERSRNHEVKKGESFYSIAKQYKVTIDDLYKWNPDSKGNLQPNLVLKIKSKATASNEKSNKKPQIESSKTRDITHQVETNETLYGIARKYAITIESIKKLNPYLDFNSLKLGTKLKLSIPETSNPVVEIPELSNSETIKHIVLPKETKYSIAKKYKKTIQELEELNPLIKNGLPSGFELLIQSSISDKVLEPIAETSSIKEINPEKIIIPEPEVIPSEQATTSKEKVLVLGSLLLDGLVEKASEYIGVKYRSGGTSKDGFDCSGLMLTTFDAFDIKLPRTSAAQADFGTTISKAEAKRGDLIFFAINGGSRVSHVGMITDVVDDEIKFIHSSVSQGVMISSNSESYYASKFVKINRVIQ